MVRTLRKAPIDMQKGGCMSDKDFGARTEHLEHLLQKPRGLSDV